MGRHHNQWVDRETGITQYCLGLIVRTIQLYRWWLYVCVCTVCLTHIWDIGKQCRPRSDAAERGVWSGSTLFAHRNFYQKYDKKWKKITCHPLNEKWTRQIIRMGQSIRQMWVNEWRHIVHGSVRWNSALPIRDSAKKIQSLRFNKL